MNAPVTTSSESSYSTRICRRCAATMVPTDGRRGLRTWHCPTCGRTER